MKKIATLEELVAEVEKDEVVTIPAGHLRDMFGKGRLGIHVRNNISARLESAGLAHYPADIPSNQWAFVRVVKANSPADRLVQAAHEPSPKTDQVILEFVRAQRQLAELKSMIEPLLKSVDSDRLKQALQN